MEKASGSGGGSSDFDVGGSNLPPYNMIFKIRNTEETSGSPYGEQAWEFKHPNFQMYNRDQLENIKRKAPAARKAAQQRAAADDGPGLQAAITQIEQLQNQLKVLKGAQKGMDDQLERNDSMCQLLVSQVRDMHKKLIEYEDLIQSLIERLSQKEFETRERVGHQRTLPEVDMSAEDDDEDEGNDDDEYDEDDEDMDDYDEDDDEYGDEYLRDEASSAQLTSKTVAKSSPYKFSYSPAFNHDEMDTNDDKVGYMATTTYDINQSPAQLDPSYAEQDSAYGGRQNAFRNILANTSRNGGQTHRKLPDLLPSKKVQDHPMQMGLLSRQRPHLRYIPNSQQQADLLHSVLIRNTPNISLPSLSDVKQELGIAGSQQPRNEKGKARDDPSGNGGRPWPILIVDDDENVRSILCRFFTSMKLEVDCADNGLTAIEKNNQNRYSIIYMDVIMPFLDGVSATRIIRKTDKTTPIICLASTSAESDNSVYQRSGMTGVLAKPFGKRKMFASMMLHKSRFPGWSPPKKRSKRYKEEGGQGETEGSNNQDSVTKTESDMTEMGKATPNDHGHVQDTNSAMATGTPQSEISMSSRKDTNDSHTAYGENRENQLSPDAGFGQKMLGNNTGYTHSMESNSAHSTPATFGDNFHMQRQNTHRISSFGLSPSYGHGTPQNTSSPIAPGSLGATQAEAQYHTVSGITPPNFGQHMGDHEAAAEHRYL
ncbi:hypothetical protein DFH27DRAFT_530040 [Peziza echinospora]|nr:hypothetical protein DFH27DRAFT_530040 [Peziza echinospora]